MNQTRNLTDWLLFAGASILWASAYAMTRGAAYGDNGLPAGVIVPSRLFIGALVLNSVVFARGRRYPPLKDVKRWLAMAGMGLMGMTLPFALITVAQRTVDSSLAAIYVAATPIFVAISANFMFSDEKLTPRVALGIGVGFLGVIILFGPAAFENFKSADAIAQFLLLVGAILYAGSTILARAAPKIDPLVFSAGFVSIAAFLSLPMLLSVEIDTLTLNQRQVFSIIGLGIGPSAIASLLYVMIVQRAGATFLALTGYSVPILSAIFGFLIYGELQSWNALLAFAFILSGVWLAQSKKNRTSIE